MKSNTPVVTKPSGCYAAKRCGGKPFQLANWQLQHTSDFRHLELGSISTCPPLPRHGTLAVYTGHTEGIEDVCATQYSCAVLGIGFFWGGEGVVTGHFWAALVGQELQPTFALYHLHGSQPHNCIVVGSSPGTL